MSIKSMSRLSYSTSTNNITFLFRTHNSYNSTAQLLIIYHKITSEPHFIFIIPPQRDAHFLHHSDNLQKILLKHVQCIK